MLNKVSQSIKHIWSQHGQVCPICNKEGTNCVKFDNGGFQDRISCLFKLDLDNKEYAYLRSSESFHTYYPIDQENLQAPAMSAKNYSKQPTAKQHAEEYKDLSSKLTLRPQHLRMLEKRGLPTNNLEALGFKTLEPSYKYKESTKLSGFIDGVSVNKTPILFIPCYGFDGSVIGYQWYTGNTGYKYIFGKGDYTVHNQHGELPDTCIDLKTSELWITEGYLKPLVSAYKHRKSHWGYGGGTNFKSRQVKVALQQFKPTTVVLVPDAGSANNLAIAKVLYKYYRYISNLGYTVKLLNYGQFQDKAVGDVDDQPKGFKYELVNFEDYVPIQTILDTINSLTPDFLEEQTKAYSGKLVGGEHYSVDNLGEFYPKVIADKSIKVFHDKSGTGAGKSHTVSKLTVTGDEKIVYCIKSPRNPTIEKIKHKFKLIDGRHDGLYIDATGRLTTQEKSAVGDKVVDSNCKYSKVFNTARDLGVDTSSFCGKCPFRGDCRVKTGDGFGFKNNYIKAITAPFIITNPISIPETVVDENTTIIIDEFTSLEAVKELTISLPLVLGRLIQQKATKASDWLNKLISNFESLNTQKLHELITPEIVALFKEASLKEQDAVGTTNQETVDMMFKDERRSMKDGKQSTISQISKQFLQPLEVTRFTDVISTPNFSVKHIDNKLNLTVVTINTFCKDVILKAGKVIVQDATVSTEELASFFGVARESVVSFELNGELATTRNIQVTGLGKISTKRSLKQIEGINAVREALPGYLNLEAVDVGFIDYGRFAKAGDLTFFSTARGSNDFESKKAIVLGGLPLPNLGAILHRYEALTGKASHLDEPSFQEYYKLKVNEEAIQAVGRLRASRRLDEQLTIVVVTDSDISLLDNLEELSVIDLVPSLANLASKKDNRLSKAQEILKEETKLTQRILAERLGISESALIKWVKRNYGCWDVFLNELVTQLPTEIHDDKDNLAEKVRSMDKEAFSKFIESLYGLLPLDLVTKAKNYLLNL